MKIIGLDGREYSWNLLKEHKRGNPSSLHLRARILLKELYPLTNIQEELTLPGTKPTLICDFFLPTYSLMVEVQGEQHYKFVPFFHGGDKKGQLNFIQAKNRDKNKREWCLINNIDLVELPFNETEEEWRVRIQDR